MRVSTRQMHEQGVDSLLRNQTLLARTQTQLASGKRLLTAADAPTDAAQALRVDQAIAASSGYLANIDAARGRLSLEETSLTSIGDVLQRMRELVLQANSGTQSGSTRQAIGVEMRQLLQQAVMLANGEDGEGGYLFGGSRADAPPFALAAMGVSYSGDQAQRLIAIGGERTLADGDPGSEVFLRLKSGNGSFDVAAAGSNAGTAKIGATQVLDPSQWDGGSYSVTFSGGNYEVRDAANALVASGAYASGGEIRFRGLRLAFEGVPADGDRFDVAPSSQQDLFATLSLLIADVESAPADGASRARQQTALFGRLQALDAAMDHVADVRASIGTRLGALDAAAEQLEGQQLALQETLSGLTDLDYAEASTRLNQQMVALQAAQQAYLRVQGLSLFDYLS